MRNLPRTLILVFIITFVTFVMTSVHATPIPNKTSNPKTFLGPTARVGATAPLGDTGAVSIAGEAGIRNFRIGGTLGWQIEAKQRIKATVELLRQQITYSFFDGRERPWMNQGAIGADYQYLFEDKLPYVTKFDLNAYYSHAPSNNLGTGTGVTDDGIPFSINKRVAGSNAAGVSPGLQVLLSSNTNLGAAVNYDNVRYDTIYRQRSADAKGFGGTVTLRQALNDDVSLGVSAAVRQPFNNYQADITWDNIPYNGTWILRLFGAYTIGKNSLPTTYNVGLGADYLFDKLCDAPPPQPQIIYKDGNFKDKPVYKDQILPPMEWSDPNVGDKEFLSWVSVPAVYMPQVLAVAEQSLCTPPTFSGVIASSDGPREITLDDFFSGSPGTYVVNFFGQDPSAITVVDHVLIYDNTVNYDTPGVSVTLTNACGSATSNVFQLFID